jgi:hypothetical protein
MLRSYSAQLKGDQIVWLDQTPVCPPGSRVLVVVETNDLPQVAHHANLRYELRDLVGRLGWKGDAVSAQRAQRDAW